MNLNTTTIFAGLSFSTYFKGGAAVKLCFGE